MLLRVNLAQFVVVAESPLELTEVLVTRRPPLIRLDGRRSGSVGAFSKQEGRQKNKQKDTEKRECQRQHQARHPATRC